MDGLVRSIGCELNKKQHSFAWMQGHTASKRRHLGDDFTTEAGP